MELIVAILSILDYRWIFNNFERKRRYLICFRDDKPSFGAFASGNDWKSFLQLFSSLRFWTVSTSKLIFQAGFSFKKRHFSFSKLRCIIRNQEQAPFGSNRRSQKDPPRIWTIQMQVIAPFKSPWLRVTKFRKKLFTWRLIVSLILRGLGWPFD